MYFSKEYLFSHTISFIVLSIGMAFPNSTVSVYAYNKPTVFRLSQNLIKPEYIRMNHDLILKSLSFVFLSAMTLAGVHKQKTRTIKVNIVHIQNRVLFSMHIQ